jgi:hypothetical protein
MKKLQLAIMAAALIIAVQARASIVFDLQYSDPSGNVANGLLTATSLGNGQYLATSGILNVTASSNPNDVGSYSLVPDGPGLTVSPSGAFIVDNVLYYPGDPYLDVDGLLGFASVAGIELNLWGNGPGNYSLYTYQPGSGYTLAYNGSATTSISPVPEATTIIAGALLLLPLGASTLRILRKSRMA